MTKYGFEFKKVIVLEHINNGTGLNKLAKKYNVSKKDIRMWVERYRAQGNEGLCVTRTHRVYDFDFKRSAVLTYLQSEGSLREIANQLGIPNYSLLGSWVNMYNKHGLEALRPKKPGRRQEMPSKDKESINPEPGQSDDSSQEKLRKLEEEIYWLRLENAVLKESRRLRLEEEAKLNAKR